MTPDPTAAPASPSAPPVPPDPFSPALSVRCLNRFGLTLYAADTLAEGDLGTIGDVEDWLAQGFSLMAVPGVTRAMEVEIRGVLARWREVNAREIER